MHKVRVRQRPKRKVTKANEDVMTAACTTRMLRCAPARSTSMHSSSSMSTNRTMELDA